MKLQNTALDHDLSILESDILAMLTATSNETVCNGHNNATTDPSTAEALEQKIAHFIESVKAIPSDAPILAHKWNEKIATVLAQWNEIGRAHV